MNSHDTQELTFPRTNVSSQPLPPPVETDSLEAAVSALSLEQPQVLQGWTKAMGPKGSAWCGSCTACGCPTSVPFMPVVGRKPPVCRGCLKKGAAGHPPRMGRERGIPDAALGPADIGAARRVAPQSVNDFPMGTSVSPYAPSTKTTNVLWREYATPLNTYGGTAKATTEYGKSMSRTWKRYKKLPTRLATVWENTSALS